WVDWLQQQASSGRSDALEALRVARGRDQAHTISASKTAPAPPLEAQAQVTKQGTVIQKVGEHEIRHTSKGLNVEGNVGDDVLIEVDRAGRRKVSRQPGCLWSSGVSTSGCSRRRRESSGGFIRGSGARKSEGCCPGSDPSAGQ